MVWYLVRCLDPEFRVAVEWEPVPEQLHRPGGGVPTGVLSDSDRPTVTLFGSRQGELQTVQGLQDAIGEFVILSGELRAVLEAGSAGPAR